MFSTVVPKSGAAFGNKGVTCQEEAGWTLCILADTYPRRDQNIASSKAVVLNLQVGLLRGQIGAVITLPGRPEGQTEPPWPGSQRDDAGGVQSAIPRHGPQTADGLQRPEQDAARSALPLAGNVQAKIHAVNEIDVGVARRSKEHSVSCRLARKSVRRSVCLTKV